MKLFLVGDFPKEDKTYGGVQGVLVNLANELMHRQDIDLVLISLSHAIESKHFRGACKTYCLDFRSSFLRARKKFDELVTAERPDVVHLQGVVPGILLYKKKYRKIFVTTQHAILDEERRWQVSIGRKLLFWAKGLIERYYFKQLRNIVFISEYNKNIYFEQVLKSEDLKFTLIPNPVNKIFFEPGNNNRAPKERELYFVGEVKKRKGLHILLRALHILEQKGIHCKLHVIGGFKEKKYEKDIKHLIRELDLSHAVVLCGWKNQAEILDYSKDIPVFVLPSFQETLPLSIAEAMCQGKIVVATAVCGIPEMITDGESGLLFPPGDFHKLAKVLEILFANTGQHNAISDRAKLASEKYRSSNVVQKTLEFYESM